MPHPLAAAALRFLGRLSYPRLFLVTAGLFLLDLVVPDIVPFADELLLGLGSLLLANWRRRGAPDQPDDGKLH